MARYLDAGLDLFDRQVLDRDGHPVGKVDDLQVTVDQEAGPPVVEALLIGPQALGKRIGGRLGRAMAGIATRLGHTPLSIPVDQVQQFGIVVRLRISLNDLPQAGALERWLRNEVVSRIPGGRHAAE